MKWFNHKLVTGTTVFLFTGNIAAVIPAMIGGIFPDFIEGDVPEEGDFIRYNIWRKRHRQLSHWFPLYFFAAVFAFGTLFLRYGRQSWGILNNFSLDASIDFTMKAVTVPELAFLFFGAYVSVGCVMHIIEDAICGKVPFVFPSTRVGVRLFKVGSLVEYVFSLFYVVAALKIRGVF